MKLQRKKKTVCWAVVLLLLGYLFCTPTGALRAAVALTGYPMSACLMQVRKATPKDVGVVELDAPENAVIYTIETHVPHETETGADLENWIVSRYGCFYFGEYYGYC